jgi:hypothetical protein
MPKQGPRPHLWKIQGKIPREQYYAYMQMQAQARFRGEEFTLTFHEFQDLWQGRWDCRGRASKDYCLTRRDSLQPWNSVNTICVERGLHLRTQRTLKTRKKNYEKIASMDH